MTKYLSGPEILYLHFRLVEDYGGAHGVRDEGRLSSVIFAPQQTIAGGQQYETIYEKAAVYLHNIILDHPFVDGNKRTGVAATGVFLMRNGVFLMMTPKTLEDYAVKIATDTLEISEIAKWLEQNTTDATKDHKQPPSSE